MNIGIYIEADLLFSLFCLLLFYQQRRHKVFDFLGSTTFNSLLWASIGIMMVDIVSWLFMGDLVPHTPSDLLLVQTVYYGIQAVLPLFFLLYCINTVGHNVGKLLRTLMSVPIFMTFALLIYNYFTGFCFYVENNAISRGPGFLLGILVPMLYIVNALILCIIFYIRSKNNTSEQHRISFHMLMCVTISFIGAVACAIVPYISPWHTFIASLVYLYIQLHGYRERTLDMLASTDSLTGVKNHAAYVHIKEGIVKKLAENPDHRFALAIMDVNNLKKTNDLLGHKAGDALIISAARLMCRVFDHSPVCRIGGDEFIAILENSDYENREELLQLFEQEMEKATYVVGGQEYSLTVALGLCAYDRNRHHTFDELFHETDTAMYENKALRKSAK